MKKKPVQKEKEAKQWPKGIYLGGILLLTLGVFASSLTNGLVSFDDEGYITQNPLLKDISFTGLKAIFSSYVMANYHPLTVLCDAVIYHFVGYQPFAYHLFSLLLHLVNIVLVFVLVKQLLNKESLALLVACLFAIHPMHVETVCWAADLKDVLYTLFYLASLICYIRYLTANQYKFLLAAGGLFVLSLFSKSAAVTLPVVLLLLDYFYDKKITVRSAAEKAPFFILSLVFGIVNIKSQGSAGAFTDISQYNILDRVCLPAYNLVYYVVTLFVPVHLSVLHPLPVKTGGSLPLIYYLSPVIVLALGGAITWFAKKYTTYRKLTILWAMFFLITVSLVIQLKPVGQAIVSERYTYLPYVGLLLLVATGYQFITDKKYNLRTALNVVLGIAVLVFSVAAYQRSHVWKDSITLLSDVIEKYPDYPKGYEWRGEVEKAAGQLPAAIADFTKAIELNPKFTDAYNNRGICRRETGDYKGALEDYTKAIELDARRGEAYNNRGIVKQDLKDLPSAIADFDSAVAINPKVASFYYNRAIAKKAAQDYAGAIADHTKAIELEPGFAQAYDSRAETKIQLKDMKGAIADYDKSVALSPGSAQSYNNRGEARRAMQDYAGAIVDYNKALELDPNLLAAYNNRGIARYFLEDYAGSIADMTNAIRLQPSALAYNNRGNVKLKLKDLAGARDDYATAITLDPRYSDAYLNLGLVQYDLKDKAGACATWTKALSLGSGGAVVQYLQLYCM